MEQKIATKKIYLARLVVEATTPLRAGSGEKGLLVDSLVAKDANGLPYIPGTSLAGVIRHEMEAELNNQSTTNALFGFQTKDAEKKSIGQGSRIIFSDANLLADDGKHVHEGLEVIDFQEGYYQYLSPHRLPERDHVRITHKGVAADSAKYEEELVQRGVRFVFEIELHGTVEDKSDWDALLHFVHQDFFRVGAGTRKGFGQLQVKTCKVKVFDLAQNKEDVLAYLNKGSSLNSDLSDWENFQVNYKQSKRNHYIHYQISLEPEDFFLFGDGIGDEDTDSTPKTERYFIWNNGTPVLTEEQILVPATSVKGAIAHRVAFYYNNLTGVTIEKAGTIDVEDLGLTFDAVQEVQQVNIGVAINSLNEPSNSEQWENWELQIKNLTIEQIPVWKDFLEKVHIETNLAKDGVKKPHVGEQNKATRTLFGYAKDEDEGARGKVIFSDVYKKYDKAQQSKVLNHVRIDRFTGGGMDGALFQEKVATATDAFTLDLYVEDDALQDENVRLAFEKTLDDLTTGQLPLGGHTTKGHGIFTGQWEKL